MVLSQPSVLIYPFSIQIDGKPVRRWGRTPSTFLPSLYAVFHHVLRIGLLHLWLFVRQQKKSFTSLIWKNSSQILLLRSTCPRWLDFIVSTVHGTQLHNGIYLFDVQRSSDSHYCYVLQNFIQHGDLKATFSGMRISCCWTCYCWLQWLLPNKWLRIISICLRI